VVPDLKGVTLQQHYDAIKAMVKQKTGRAMQEKKVTVIGKNGKPKERNGSSPIRESVVNIKPDTTMADLQKYTDKVHQRWGVRAIHIHIHKALLERLKVLRDLIFATCSLNFKKVVQIIVDQWKAGVKQFTKDLKDFLLKAMSVEKTVEGRKSYVKMAVTGICYVLTFGKPQVPR
jgi:hypothetical protein